MLPSSLNMDATTLRLNWTRKNASRLPAGLAKDHDLVPKAIKTELKGAQFSSRKIQIELSKE